MPYEKTFVCLANSFKIGGSCIAGKEGQADGSYGDWIRPISARASAEVQFGECRYDNYSAPKLLDIIKVSLLAHTPHGHQTENHIIDTSRRWAKVGTFPWGELGEICDTPDTLWINSDCTDTGTFNCISTDEAATQEDSLKLIRPENFNVVVESKTWDGVTNKKYRGSFVYNGEYYNLSLTDPAVTNVYKTKEEGEYPLEDVYICVSLTEPNVKENVPRCHKLVAAIFSEQPLR